MSILFYLPPMRVRLAILLDTSAEAAKSARSDIHWRKRWTRKKRGMRAREESSGGGGGCWLLSGGESEEAKAAQKRRMDE